MPPTDWGQAGLARPDCRGVLDKVETETWMLDLESVVSCPTALDIHGQQVHQAREGRMSQLQGSGSMKS